MTDNPGLLSSLNLFINAYHVELFYCLLAYLIGAIPFGVIVSRLMTGKDVRATGSGNIGATNVSRMMGKKWGVIVLILDALKGFAVVFASGWVGVGSIELANSAACAAIVGHCFPIYLKFRGGKGVATALGVIAALSPALLGGCVVVFLIAVGLSRRISPASLAAALALPVLAAVFQTPLIPQAAALMTIIVWWKHHENILRLIRGEEPRFF